MYGALAWNPILRKDINSIEKNQKRFTKYADMIFVYKALHCLVDCSAVSIGLEQKTSCTRGDGIKLNQRRAATTRASSQLFAIRAPSAWNKLSLHITGCKSFIKFKRLLKKHLSAQQ